MPTVRKHEIKENCPKCGTTLVEIVWEFDPFPSESGSLEHQTSHGCGNCGWQKIISSYADYDPYNPNKQAPLIEFKKEDFRV